jgi:hypothetical protein
VKAAIPTTQLEMVPLPDMATSLWKSALAIGAARALI